MAGIALEFNVDDLLRVSDRFERLAGTDTQPLMEEIGEYILSRTLENFENQETPEGEDWKPSQRALAEGGKTLIDRGHLLDSYTYKPSSDSVETGSNSDYAAIHHEGGRAGRNRAVEIDARTALGLNDADQNEIGEMALQFYRENF